MMKTVALIGHPNCGKSTLFNALTDGNQQVGNWPGVTVERVTGIVHIDKISMACIDLPGIQALLPDLTQASVDEKITTQYLLEEQPDMLIHVVDASQLESHLYLTLQLMCLQIPMLVVLNCMDIVERQKIQINVKRLSNVLGCPVIPIIARDGIGLQVLKTALLKPLPVPISPVVYPDAMTRALALLPQSASMKKSWYALEMGVFEDPALNKPYTMLTEALGESPDIVLAEARYQWISAHLPDFLTVAVPENSSLKSRDVSFEGLGEGLDKWLLHRVWGVPFFIIMMYGLFFCAVHVGGLFQDFFDLSGQAIFVDGFQQILNAFAAPVWLSIILTQGIGLGLHTVATFIPVLAVLFLLLSFLEDCGYMARAALVVDKVLRYAGLPGKSFVPLLIGFGCNVPAIMAARTLTHARDRILTVLMTPFMACGARLAIFAVFGITFFAGFADRVIFSLYLVGIMIALLSGWLLQKTLLPGDLSPLMMDLPRYQWPVWRTLFRRAGDRLMGFLWRAGRLIVPMCLLLGLLNHIDMQGRWLSDPRAMLDQTSVSVLAAGGQRLTPLLGPMGISQENWPASVGLLTGVLAKEVVVATLNTLYSSPGSLLKPPTVTTQLVQAWQSIGMRFGQLFYALRHPLMANAKIENLSAPAAIRLHDAFGDPWAAYAYCLFVLLYVPCVSTVAMIARELTVKWAIFSLCWSTSMAYTVAVCFWQLANFLQHPLQSLAWCAGLCAVWSSVLWGLSSFRRREEALPS